jgi:uncharacterized protein
MTRSADVWPIIVGADQTFAAWDPPAGGTADRVFVLAHGAGGNMDDNGVVQVADALRERGIGTVRFNFFYRARNSRRPDPMPRLLTCLEAVAARTVAELEPATLVLGGRSMGGRAASVLVANGARCNGLLLLAYPLHPPGQPEKLRVAHLSSIHVPVLCINGTRDPFCDPPLMERTLNGLGSNWRMHWLDHADHSFHVLKSSGRSDRDVLNELADDAAGWIKHPGHP